jgi:hypothetical protein
MSRRTRRKGGVGRYEQVVPRNRVFEMINLPLKALAVRITA